ncbi:MAG: hypothetical protein FWG10_02930 [Eubacteriaceae bacterium]|nr:hypothetical protein [Eubacteriaceae bacterium]
MTSFVMSKHQMVVLFSLLSKRAIPIGFVDLLPVCNNDRIAIVRGFIENKILIPSDNKLNTDKNLEAYLEPIFTSEKVLILSYGISELGHLFNATFYTSKGSLVALLDLPDNMVQMVKFDNYSELDIFLPSLSQSREMNGEYINYVLFRRDTQTVHSAKKANGLVDVEELVADVSQTLAKQIFTTSLKDYQKLFANKAREVFDVFNQQPVAVHVNSCKYCM